VRTFASLMDFSQPVLFVLPLFPVVNFAFLITFCTQFQHLFLGYPPSRLLWGLLLNT
jgi:hypothetical protein